MALTLETAGSMLQVSLFSAPKGVAVWSEVLDLLTNSLDSQGAQIEQRVGSFGRELLVNAQIGGDGNTQTIRFIGVDGPRWLLRGSITGAALQEATENAEIERVFRSLIIDRGDAPMPPRELISLTMPAGTIAPPARPQ